MHWLLTPYDRHSDTGFGAMAEAFKASAETLLATEKHSVLPRELPACFLLRHAAELFLKSALVVTHKIFTEVGGGYPAVVVDGKLKPMTSVHSLGALYSALVDILTKNYAELEARGRTSWLPMPAELDQAIGSIDHMDSRGVFFRYPTESNSIKSANKPISPEELAAWDQSQRGYLKALFVLDQNDELVEAFHYDSNLLVQELSALKAACYWLDCIHVGLRVELAGGW